MVSQKYLLEILTTLSKANSEIRNCIETNKVFKNLKCRPKLNQKTRWCAAITLLLSNKRAFEKGAYDNETVCPITFHEIETYIQILMPAYWLTLAMQKNRSSIADIIPGVLRLVHIWDKMELQDAKAKELCYFLIHFARIKFKYELESPIYQVCLISNLVC